MPFPGEPAIRVEGLREVRRNLRQAGDRETPKQVRAAHKDAAKVAEGKSRGRASSSEPQQQRAAAALLGKGTPAAAVLAIRNTGAVPFGVGAFMGAKQFRQFPAWVGNAWDLEAGVGPYVVAEAIRDGLEEITDTYLEALRRAFRDAGLEWE